MKTMHRKAILALLLFAFPVFAQEQPFQERVDVNVVLLDTIVTDSDGNQILGLGPEDFIVREGGVEQKIDSVDYFTSRRLLNAREENAPFKVERMREERYLVFFFDKPTPGSLMTELMRARASVQRFIEKEMLESDRVAIVGHDVRLKVYSDFTSDRAALRRALNEVTRFGVGLKKQGGDANQPSILRNVDASDMAGETGTAYQALHVLADSLRKIPARKNLVIFSAGMHEPMEEIRDGMIVNSSRYLQPAIDALNAANVTAYGINILTPIAGPTEPMYHQSLERITEGTNGRYFRNQTSFEPALEQVEKATSGYYLITYRPSQRKRDGSFQRVEVSLRNPEFRVKSRAGYLAE